ncbi:MAG: dihydroorotate dehydrogenase [Nitrososphaerota archaeon]|nr:dihydroorotate dehydrogenase [Nitrososphaerota archaeon]
MADRKGHQRSARILPSSIGTDLSGVHLASPTMIASGVLGISFELFPRIISSGCGAIVSKSIGQDPREGYGNPTMTGVDGGYLNAIGLANPGAKEFARELEESRDRAIPLVVSIFADSADRFANLARFLEKPNFFAYELNLSCPHVKEVGSEIGTDPEEAANIIRRVKKSSSKPVFAKMPSSIPNVSLWAKRVEDAGADAIVAINTIRAMKIDIETQKPVLSNKIGGLSGTAIKPVGVRCVYEIYEAVKIPVIGVGGISNSSDAIEYILAGATCVQVGSAMARGFLGTFGEINEGIAKYVKRKGFSHVGELVGYGHK